MGWHYQRVSRAELIDELTRDREHTRDDGVLVRTRRLARCLVGNVLWSVWERTYTLSGAETEPSARWIRCDLLARIGGGIWGYKPLDESMHPYYYSCPLSYLELVPLDRYGGCQEWREGVREHHARRAEARRAKRQRLTAGGGA